MLRFFGTSAVILTFLVSDPFVIQSFPLCFSVIADKLLEEQETTRKKEEFVAHLKSKLRESSLVHIRNIKTKDNERIAYVGNVNIDKYIRKISVCSYVMIFLFHFCCYYVIMSAALLHEFKKTLRDNSNHATLGGRKTNARSVTALRLHWLFY